MDKKKIFLYLILLLLLISVLTFFVQKTSKPETTSQVEQTELQDNVSVKEEIVQEDTKTAEEDTKTQTSEQPVQVKTKQAKKVSKTAAKTSVKEPVLKTVVEGNSIRIVTPESKPQKVIVPETEPRTNIVDVRYEYKTKTPRKYIFK